MKPFHLLPRPTVLMRLAWYRGDDRMRGEHPYAFNRSRKGNHRATSTVLSCRPPRRITPDVHIALFTPKSKRRSTKP